MVTRKEPQGKVLCIFTGGTIAMEPETLSSLHGAGEILDFVKEITELAVIDARQICNIDSVEMQPHHWVEVARTIYDEYERYDGFVVLHGTDTMVYTAGAVSFILQKLGKPVIFTGSQIPLYSRLASDARNNLINSVRFALMDVAEVCIFFGSVLLRGNRAHKISGFDINAFKSFSNDPLGTAGVRLNLYRGRKRRSKGQPVFTPDLESRVCLLKVYPSMDIDLIDILIAKGYRGIVLEAYGAGNIPVGEKSLIPGIQRAISAGIPVVVSTQCEKGSAEDLYPAGKMLRKCGAIAAHDMTPEASLVKLMWVLGQTSSPGKIRRLMERSLADEIS
jgi:L-asparaginase